MANEQQEWVDTLFGIDLNDQLTKSLKNNLRLSDKHAKLISSKVDNQETLTYAEQLIKKERRGWFKNERIKVAVICLYLHCKAENSFDNIDNLLKHKDITNLNIDVKFKENVDKIYTRKNSGSTDTNSTASTLDDSFNNHQKLDSIREAVETYYNMQNGLEPVSSNDGEPTSRLTTQQLENFMRVERKIESHYRKMEGRWKSKKTAAEHLILTERTSLSNKDEIKAEVIIRIIEGYLKFCKGLSELLKKEESKSGRSFTSESIEIETKDGGLIFVANLPVFRNKYILSKDIKDKYLIPINQTMEEINKLLKGINIGDAIKNKSDLQRLTAKLEEMARENPSVALYVTNLLLSSQQPETAVTLESESSLPENNPNPFETNKEETENKSDFDNNIKILTNHIKKKQEREAGFKSKQDLLLQNLGDIQSVYKKHKRNHRKQEIKDLIALVNSTNDSDNSFETKYKNSLKQVENSVNTIHNDHISKGFRARFFCCNRKKKAQSSEHLPLLSGSQSRLETLLRSRILDKNSSSPEAKSETTLSR